MVKREPLEIFLPSVAVVEMTTTHQQELDQEESDLRKEIPQMEMRLGAMKRRFQAICFERRRRLTPNPLGAAEHMTDFQPFAEVAEDKFGPTVTGFEHSCKLNNTGKVF
jgi:hypothetical protein